MHMLGQYFKNLAMWFIKGCGFKFLKRATNLRSTSACPSWLSLPYSCIISSNVIESAAILVYNLKQMYCMASNSAKRDNLLEGYFASMTDLVGRERYLHIISVRLR